MKAVYYLTRSPQCLAGLVMCILACYSMPASTAETAHDKLPLNGIASYWELTQEVYIAALYLEVPRTSTPAVMTASGIKRMEFRITADKWRQRSFARGWNQAIVRNNSEALNKALAEEIQTFVGILGDSLVYGDKVTIDFTPKLGAKVYINDILVTTINNDSFFNALLNAWIGPRPPSTDFKDNILGSTDQALLSRFNSVNPPNPTVRQKEIRQWVSDAARVAEEARQQEAGSTSGGSSSGAPAKKASSQSQSVAKNIYRLAVVKEALQRMIYPAEALWERQEGTVVMKVTLADNGGVAAYEIETPTKFDALNEAAINAILRSSFPEFPEEIEEATLDFLIPIKFVVPRRTDSSKY